MADSFIQLPADSTGKKVDTRTESTNSEHREIHIVGDPSNNEGVSVVTNVDPTGETYGLVVRDPNTTTIASNTSNLATLKFGSGYGDQALRIIHATDVAASVNLEEINGVSISTGSGVSGTGVIRTMLASDSIMSTLTMTDNIANQDLPGVASFMVGYDGSTWDRAVLSSQGSGETQTNTLRVVQATDAVSSVQISGISRTANPTAIADGSNVRASFDDIGRQLIRPVQVRDLVFTARVAKTTGSTFGTETTLLAASAGNYHDLIYLTATNDSTVAVTLDIRSVTAGNITMSYNIPAASQINVTPPVPIPQDATGNNWTIDLNDVTGTNVNVFALFTREP